MNRIFRAAVYAVALGSPLSTAAAADPPALPPPAAEPAASELAADALKSDPAVRYGRLANGMRYALMKNATPPGEASLRLRVDAGSLAERDDTRGLAHFLEHMVLNGTKNVPEGEFVKRLERAGLRFGPDTNATTDFEQTVFKLDLPKTDAASVGEALFLLREVADEATLAASAIDAERGIVLSEERNRATPSFRTSVDQAGFLFRDQLMARRFPIGTTEIVASLPREAFAQFYHAYYRPEKTTLVAVGDFDMDAMEARIRAGFDSWRGEGDPGPAPDRGALAKRGPEARIFAEPGLPHAVSLNWLRPYDDRPDSAPLRVERMVEALALRVLNRRLERIAYGEDPPFVGASASRSAPARTAEQVRVGAVAAPGRWRDALAAIDREQRRLVQFGVTQGEVDREVAEYRAGFSAAADAAATRPTRALAGALVAALDDEEVFMTPADAFALFRRNQPRFTAAAVDAVLPTLFSGEGPLLYMTAPTAVAGGDDALLAAYDASRETAVAASAAPPPKAFPYRSFGAPGAVVERREIGDGIDATAVRFANGTRLTVKSTKLERDRILVAVDFGRGRSGMSPQVTIPGTLSAALLGGGLGQLTLEELKGALPPNVYRVEFGVGNEAFRLSRGTRRGDFASTMRLIAAYLTDPAWRPTSWNRARSLGDTDHDRMESSPAGVFGRDAPELLASGDRRWRTPTRAEIAAGTVDDARALLGEALATEPLEVVIVGDVTVENAIAQVAATLGALAERPAADAPAHREVRFPAPTPEPVVRTHGGRADQGLAFIAWPTDDFRSDRRRARALALLAQVLQLRLNDEIREKQGTTYSPSAGHTASEAWPGYGYLSASIQARPDKLAGFFADAGRIAAELAATPPTADELERARAPAIARIRRGRSSSNAAWIGALDDIQTDPRIAEDFRTLIPDLEAVTPDELERLAREYLTADKAWRMIVVPEGKSASPASDVAASR